MREFFDWWITQLKALLPDGLKSRLRQELCLLYLDVQRDRVRASASYQNKAYSFGEVDNAEAGEEHPGLRRFVNELPRRPDRILVRIGQGRYLSREVELPLAAEDNLAEAIGFQLEQLTPFSADQVLCFSGVSERLTAQNKLRAWLTVTPAEQVDRVLQLLGGPPPTPVHMPRKPPPKDASLEIAFRPFGQSDGGSFRGALLMGVLLVLLFAAVFSLHIINRVQTRDHLQQVLADARIEAAEASRLQEGIETQRDQALQLAQIHAESPQIIPLWDDLSQRLDDDTWLQRIDLRDRKLTMQGISADASRLIEQLEDSPFLNEVRFGASVTRDRSSDKERFNITAQLAKTPESES